MAKKRARAEALPQKFDVWQVDARQASAEVRSGERAVRPWMAVVASSTEGLILAVELSEAEPTAEDVWQTVLKAMQKPEAGKPHRPTEVQVRDEPWAAGLRTNLQNLGIEVQTVAELDATDELFEELTGQIAAQDDGPGLLDAPGVTPDMVASLFDAAALFYEQAPWSRSGERPIRVECSAFESGPWFAIIMGQGGMTSGLVLYDRLETLLKIQEGDLPEEESARLTAGLAVVFGDKEDLVPSDAEALAAHNWHVAGPDAYPSAYRVEPGLIMRPPLAWELRLLEGCLRGVPEFVRKKTRRVGPFPIAVPTAEGELPLVLSWAVEG